MQYRCKEGDMLDWICWRQYGGRSGAVEAVLEANPGLAAHGPRLPTGLLIELPELPETPSERTAVRLWD